MSCPDGRIDLIIIDDVENGQGSRCLMTRDQEGTRNSMSAMQLQQSSLVVSMEKKKK